MFVTKLVSFADKVTQLSKQLDDAKAQTDCCAVFWPLLRKLCMLGLDVACVRYFVAHLHCWGSFHEWEACAARGAEETAQLKSECMAQRHKRPTFQPCGDCCAVILMSKSSVPRLQERREEQASFAAQQAIGRGRLQGTRASEPRIDHPALSRSTPVSEGYPSVPMMLYYISPGCQVLSLERARELWLPRMGFDSSWIVYRQNMPVLMLVCECRQISAAARKS